MPTPAHEPPATRYGAGVSSAVPPQDPTQGVDAIPRAVHDPGFGADLLSAWRTSWPFLLGYIPLGIGFGVVLTAAGFPWWWALISSILIYGGSIQYLMVDLLTGGASSLQVAVATFFVQFRHIFYGLTHPIKRVRGLPGKAYIVHSLTDEVYALLAPYRDRPTTGRFLVLTQIMCHTWWVTGSVLGALIGSGLGLDVDGIDFVMTALFTVLTIETYKGNPDKATGLVATTIGMVCYLVFGTGMLIPAMTAFIVFLLIRFQYERTRKPADDARPTAGAQPADDAPTDSARTSEGEDA